MALLQRLRTNSQFGVLDTEADGVTDTLSSPEFAGLPSVGAGQFLTLILDPEKENGASEIVHVTAHSAGATTLTVERGRENTSARVHPTGTIWRHGPTTFDFGNGHRSLADNNAAFGNGAQVDDTVTGATALGANAQASGANCVALGPLASAGASAALALGSSASASAPDSVAAGRSAVADGEDSLAIGTISLASGMGATAVGHGARADGIRSAALGEDAVAMHQDSTAVGTGANTDKVQQVKLGTTGQVTTLGGGLEVPVKRRTADYVMDSGSKDRVLLIDATAGPVTVTLIAAAGNEGRVLTIKKVDASANEVTIDGNAAETIDGAATQLLSAQYEDLTLVSDGFEWFIIG